MKGQPLTLQTRRANQMARHVARHMARHSLGWLRTGFRHYLPLNHPGKRPFGSGVSDCLACARDANLAYSKAK